ncbi:MAG: phosphoadenylyl-sulfate reductase [Rhodospirillales bacterium]|nr:MAG: phosphoadenylyl-sulfate reductase [Rhodospirillales bacterium]
MTVTSAGLRHGWPTATADPVGFARSLDAAYADADAEELLAAMIGQVFTGRIALTSSFGAEAAVLLHLVARVDPATPVIFLNTGKLFGETLRYRDTLVGRLGLTDLRSLTPDAKRIDDLDADGVLWYGNPDMCCYIRKVEPLERALDGFIATITGRKGFHGGDRSDLPRVEAADDGRFKVNPLARWRKEDVESYFAAHDLPRHPLEADGFLSIGCMPCTDRVAPGEDIRAGRWRGREKSECGIHLPKGRWQPFDSGI